MTIKLLLLSLAITLLVTIPLAFDHNNNNNVKAPIEFASSHHHEEAMILPLPGLAVGPESLEFDRTGGGPYTGVSDGRIIRWMANESRWLDFAVTSSKRDGCEGGDDNSEIEHVCGRPLGLRFNKKRGDLYIADAYMGLLVVGPNGGLASPVSKEVDGTAFRLTNGLDIDQSSGVVYFTDSSARFPRRNHVSVIMTGDNTGRILKFNPKTNQTTLVLNNLKFPNGIALSQNGDFLLFTETPTCNLYRFWLKTPKSGNLELVAHLPGYPDNIKRSANGEFWVGVTCKKGMLASWIVSKPWIGKWLIRTIPVDFTKMYTWFAGLVKSMGMGIRLDVHGEVVEVLDYGKGKKWEGVSEVNENEGSLWIGSVTRSVVIKDNKYFEGLHVNRHLPQK